MHDVIRIRDVMKKQTRRRRGRGGQKVTLGLCQKTAKGRQRSLASRDIHHRSDQIPNHMMEEAVSGDSKREPEPLPGFPTGFVNGAPVSPLGLSRLGEGLEGILAHDGLGRALEKCLIQRIGEGPAPTPVERRPGFCRKPEVIEIRALHGVIAGMEIGRGGLYTLDPDVIRQYSGQGLLEFCGLPRIWKGGDGHLAGRMNAAIGSSRSDHRATGTCELLQGRLQLPLNGALLALYLPAVEGGSIILKNQLEAIVLHGVHARKVGGAQALSSRRKKDELEPSKSAVGWARGRRIVT